MLVHHFCVMVHVLFLIACFDLCFCLSCIFCVMLDLNPSDSELLRNIVWCWCNLEILRSVITYVEDIIMHNNVFFIF